MSLLKQNTIKKGRVYKNATNAIYKYIIVISKNVIRKLQDF